MAEQLCTFRVGDLLVGIDIGRVQEVLADPEVTPVPLAPPAIAGLLNLRGQILTVVDGRTRLGLPEHEPDGGTYVILHVGGEAVALVVDVDGEVVDVDPAQLEVVPSTVSGLIRSCALGAYQLEEGLLVELDVDLVLAAS